MPRRHGLGGEAVIGIDGLHSTRLGGVPRLRRDLLVGVSVADDLQRCLGWSTALAAPQPATSVTLLLAILEAGRGTTAQRGLDDAGVTTHDLEPLEVAARARNRRRRTSSDWESRSGPHPRCRPRAGVATSDRLGIARQATSPDRRRHVPGPPHRGWPSQSRPHLAGQDPGAMRSEVMRSRPVPDGAVATCAHLRLGVQPRPSVKERLEVKRLPEGDAL
jgi:hypothetical protein